jgi:hypothetical protein
MAPPPSPVVENDMRQPIVAWAADCVVRGDVSLDEGRLSDRVNELELLTFFGATLEALDDGHEVLLDELEVERRELHLIEVDGRRGDPARRLRTVEERVTMEIGPFVVTGNLHRAPQNAPLAALAGWAKFVPVTDVEFTVPGHGDAPARREVILINRDRIAKTIPSSQVQVHAIEPWESAANPA